MLIDVDKTLDRTITVYNKAAAKDVGDKYDRFVRHVLYPCNWQETVQHTPSSDGTLAITRLVKIQVPASTASYLPYGEWLGDMSGSFTASTGDIWCLGEGAEADTKAGVMDAVKGLPSCETSAVRDLRNNDGVTVPLSGVLKYASIVYVEGV